MLRLQQWRFHQAKGKPNLFSNIASAWKKKKECMVRHQWYFEHAREERVELYTLSGSMDRYFRTSENLVDEAKQSCHELGQCWCTWEEGNTLISDRARVRGREWGWKTAKFASVQTGPYLGKSSSYNSNRRKQNWVVGRKSFGWNGWASVSTLWTVVGVCEGDSDWRRNFVRERAKCTFCGGEEHLFARNSHRVECDHNSVGGDKALWEIFEGTDVFDVESLLTKEKELSLLEGVSFFGDKMR